MSNILAVLYQTNNKLARRVKKGAWFYGGAIVIICLTLIPITIVYLFHGPLNSNAFQKSLKFLAFFVAMFDVIAIIIRIQSRSFIEPYQLALFPISKWKKLLFHIALFVLDYKSLIYLSMISCFICFYATHSLYLAAIISIPVWMLLLLAILSWTMVLYGFLGKYLDKMGNKIQFIGLFFMAIIIAINLFGDNILAKIPITSYVGYILYGLWIDSSVLIWTNLLLLLAGLLFPLALFGLLRSTQ